MSHTLYQRIGGKDAVNAAVDLLYYKILADPRVNHYFHAIDMKRQIAHFKIFLTFAFGGAPAYEGKSLREAHRPLNLREEHFAAVLQNLQETLEELKMSPPLLAEVLAAVTALRPQILNLEPPSAP
jgi:hemoglobin